MRQHSLIERQLFITAMSAWHTSAWEPRCSEDCVDGLVWSTPNLARMDGYPDLKIVYRTDWNKDKAFDMTWLA